MTPEEKIKAFVEGAMSVDQFELAVQSDSSIEALLSDERQLPAYIQEPDLYAHIISQDYKKIGAIYNVQILLSNFLQKKNVLHTVDKKYEELLELTLKVQPKWLDLPSDYFFEIIKDQGKLKAKELREWLKAKINNDFRCLKAPPKWLQGPDWPIIDRSPLVFAGQLDISGLSHDDAQLYIFFNEHTGEFFTVKQSC